MRMAIIAIIIPLAACQKFASGNERICLDPASAIALGALNLRQETCIHKWSYRLAGAPGSNTEIAQGVLGACEEAILVKDDTVNAAVSDSELRRQAKASALFHVTQARAGDCAIP
jgi:hypothetical protein